jgi:uracil-DNA glycosylase
MKSQTIKDDHIGAERVLAEHIRALKGCTRCPLMVGPVVTHTPVLSKVFLVGQAPGPHEGAAGKPFAWTAGKTLFRWFERIGINEEQFRALTYMAAVCRCFPGKAKSGGDRVPNPDEIKNCSGWMEKEFKILKPKLVIPVGKLAIEQILGKGQLVEVIGQSFDKTLYGVDCQVVPLPHPSGASTWFKKEPGITLLQEGLNEIAKHPSWRAIVNDV